MKSKIFKMCALFTAVMMLAAGAAGCGKTESLSGEGEESVLHTGIECSVTSLDSFKAAAAEYGDVYDMTESLGYQSAAVSSSGINIIYMMLDDAAAAKSMALGDLGSEGVELDIISSGVNYDYYEETSDGSADAEVGSIYGLYLRVDNMLMLVTGPLEKKDEIRSKAAAFYNSLGYPEI